MAESDTILQLGIDAAREGNREEARNLFGLLTRQEPDNLLGLIFMCCHAAIAPEAQIALTLRAVCGLTTGEIARAFLVSDAMVAQRMLRARKKIGAAGIPYALPRADELDGRLYLAGRQIKSKPPTCTAKK